LREISGFFEISIIMATTNGRNNAKIDVHTGILERIAFRHSTQTIFDRLFIF